MQLLISIMIFSGSALMVYNIIRYAAFIKRTNGLENGSRQGGLLIVPLLLLIFFLIGYVVVGISRIANLMMAGILLGGSIFVFLMLTVMYKIIGHIRETDDILTVRYEEMRSQVQALTKDALAVVLVNLTRDEVEERAGDDLYESDLSARTYTEIFETRVKSVISPNYPGADKSPFRREELIRRYHDGETRLRDVLLVRQREGAVAYVSFEASLSQMPLTGDVVAMITERPYNEAAVEQVLLKQVLMDQYDRVAYLIDGEYTSLISNDGKKNNLLLPADRVGTYESMYYDYILPTMVWDREAGPNPLRLSIVDKALAAEDLYEVNAPFVIGGEQRFKRVVFYVVDRSAKFYVMLISDSTNIEEEQAKQNQRLEEAVAEAVRQSEARIKFFTRVSHDLRTPMNGIIGYSNLAKNETDPAKVREYLDRMDWSGKKLVSLMDDLFAMSLIDSDSLVFARDPLDLGELARDLESAFTVSQPDKTVHLSVDTSGLIRPHVLGDAARLKSILSRLLENAMAFVPDGKTVDLVFSQEDTGSPETETCYFSVENIGEYMPPEIVEHIYEEETWEKTEKSAELPGVGLGMVVVKAFVEQMGGEITARSDENGDTSFRIRLDMPTVAEPEEPAGDAPELPMHILLVDDNPVNREIGELMLTSEGWTVEQACDGAEAVEAVRNSVPGSIDLILMDVQMPGMNGYEATAKIRALPDPVLASTPILAVTANAYQDDANEALAAGMDGYVAKPIDLDVIRREAARVLKKGDRTGE